MSAISVSLKIPRLGREIFDRLWKTNHALTRLGFASLGLLVLTVVLASLDLRVINGTPAWVKPIKFAVSSTFYTFTLVWMLSYVRGQGRLVRLVGNASALALSVELVLIVLQVARGVRSHFNFSTPLDGAIYSTMAVFILVVWALNLVAAILLLRQPLADRPLAWSLRLGLLIALIGSGVGALMTQPTPSQLAGLQAGRGSTIIGAHSVGVEDGGPGLPFLGWSTQGGDLRVAHFFGLHALQVIPLTGFAANKYYRKRMNEKRRMMLVWTIGLGYLGLVLLLIWQALRGQPIIAPDRLTLAAFGALLIGGAGAFSLIASGKSKTRSE